MIKQFSIAFCLVYAFASCGKKTTEDSSSESNPTNVTFANPGPQTCLASSSANIANKLINPYYANFREALNSPFQIKSIKHLNIGIVGPDSRTSNAENEKIDNTTNCNAIQINNSDTSAKNVANNNTVGIYFPTSKTVCTGSLVSDGKGHYLILTAAHCFNQTSNFDSENAEGAIITFGNTIQTTINAYSSSVECWQRNKYYRNSPNNDDTTSLFDIAWIRLPSSANDKITHAGYTPVKLLGTPSDIQPTEEKLMAGFGTTIDPAPNYTDRQGGDKRCISTNVDPKYSSRGDIIPSGAVASFNNLALTNLGSTIASNAYQTYLTVVGPINGLSSAEVKLYSNNGAVYPYSPSQQFSGISAGTCYGDSGGALYVKRNGDWVLAALTEGSNTTLTPHPIVDFTTHNSSDGLSATSNFNFDYPGLCLDGYGIYTTVGNYAAPSQWIEETSGITLEKTN
jgi:hypothetical protein